MGSYENFVRKALDGIGGVSNIRHVSRCTRSIRIDYKHKKEIKEEVLKALPDCAGYVNRNHQVQLIIGKEAEAAYADFLSVSGWDPDHEPADTEPPEPDEYGPHNVRYYVNQFGNFVTPIFMPIIPALIVGGLILAVRNLLVNYFGVSMDSGAANLMTAIFQAGFTALPVYIGWTTCMKLKLSPILGMMLGYLMIGTTYTSGLITDIFGITVPQVNYGSSIMPVMLGVFFMYYVDKLLEKIIPQILKFFLKPLLTMVIVVPVTLLFLGPIGNTLSQYVASFILWINDTLGFIAQPILCVFYPYMVMLGLDKALSPIGIQLIAEVGYNPVTSVMGFVSNLCIGASTLAVAASVSDEEQKGMMSSFGVTALCGVTEPAFYGCLISRPDALRGTAVGAACAGLFAGIFGLRTFVQGGCPGLLTFVFFIDNNGGFHYVIIALITAAIAIAVSFLATKLIMNKNRKKGMA